MRSRKVGQHSEPIDAYRKWLSNRSAGWISIEQPELLANIAARSGRESFALILGIYHARNQFKSFLTQSY